ncbi:hypothetical protein LZ009_08145 [Ramlibacter sp. XY19]|uniref:hypothetical protein n=1 Tax=Ramlibacter paludis TaxID=2908000 RepID=UPI0023DC25B7|nr:hypothetical protein [Ramlibacter paludis]MCG2592752.1 hypothetical protein [Ramlibacter paludis]
MKALPRSPSELRGALVSIFPALPRDFGEQGESVFEDAGPTYQSVLRDFAAFFARDVAHSSDRQLARLAALVAGALETPDPLGVAMQECFVDELRQLKVLQRLEPFLAAARK